MYKFFYLNPLLNPFATISWEMTMRAFSDLPKEELARRYYDFVGSGMCFERLEFGLGGVSPAAMPPVAVSNARLWRLALLRQAQPAAPFTQRLS